MGQPHGSEHNLGLCVFLSVGIPGPSGFQDLLTLRKNRGLPWGSVPPILKMKTGDIRIQSHAVNTFLRTVEVQSPSRHMETARRQTYSGEGPPVSAQNWGGGVGKE